MEDPIQQLLNNPPVVINLGLKKFAKSLDGQNIEVLQVDWSPPAGGDQEMIDLLDDLL
jgi:FdrA protein